MRAYISCIAFLFFTISWTQTTTLSGLCLDEKERPLSEVNIQFQGHSVQQFSNEKGVFHSDSHKTIGRSITFIQVWLSDPRRPLLPVN
jgi:hypothetical protein